MPKGTENLWLIWSALLEETDHIVTEASEAAWLKEAEHDFKRMREAVAVHPEAVAWLQWFAPLQEDDGLPREHSDVEAQLPALLRMVDREDRRSQRDGQARRVR